MFTIALVMCIIGIAMVGIAARSVHHNVRYVEHNIMLCQL